MPDYANGAAAAQAPFKEAWVSWQHPLDETRISMHSDIVKTLSGEALKCLLGKPATEIGGILWGSFNPESNDDTSVRISDAKFVSTDGPFFNETSADRNRLEAALAQGNGAGMIPVGYFRSYIRDDLCLTTQDQHLIESQMQDPRFIFLVIRPFEMGICMAGFFFWQNGRLQTEASDLEVPFVALDSSQRNASLSPSSRAVEAPPMQKATDPPRLSLLEERSPPKDQAAPLSPAQWAEPRQGKRHLARIIAAAAVVLVFTAWLGYLMANAWFSRSHSGSVNLRVTRLSDGQLDLLWDRTASKIADASKATITIRDGTLDREVILDKTQLLSGRLIYVPMSSDVQFRLDLTNAKKRLMSESVQFVHPVLSDNKPGPRTLPYGEPARQAAAQPRAQAESELSLQSRTVPAPTLPKRRLQEAETPRSANALSYRPPRPIKQIMPDVGRIQPVDLARGSRVRVQVVVNEWGKVTEVSAIRNGSNANEALISAALGAAAEWTFNPATLGGKPVPAKHVILFEFSQPPR